MRKIILTAVFCLLVAMIAAGAIAGNDISVPGPAPSSGDGISEGSGLDNPFTNGCVDDVCPGPAIGAGSGIPWTDEPGAPNAGDGVSDGSGW